MSRGEDLFGNELNTFNTSADETSGKATSGEPFIRRMALAFGTGSDLLFE